MLIRMSRAEKIEEVREMEVAWALLPGNEFFSWPKAQDVFDRHTQQRRRHFGFVVTWTDR